MRVSALPDFSQNAIRKIIFLLWIVLLPLAAQAEPVSEKDVIKAVQTWVRTTTPDARVTAVVDKLEPYRFDGKPAGYIAHLQDGGFCICGADDLLLPVYLYNPRGQFDPQNPDYQQILGSLTTRLASVQSALAEKGGTSTSLASAKSVQLKRAQ